MNRGNMGLFKALGWVMVCMVILMSSASCHGENTLTVVHNEEKLAVFAASSLTGVFTKLAQKFEKEQNGEIKVTFNFAGSQVLRTAIEAGADADIFASADSRSMDTLLKSGLISKYDIFARNSLALVMNTGSNFKVKTLGDLGQKGLKLAIADESVPVGAYWKKALKLAEDSGQLSASGIGAIDAAVVTKELNVKDVLSKVFVGDADAGIVYATDAFDADKNRIREIRIPILQKVDISYPVAVLKASEGNVTAESFYNFLLSDSAKNILKKFGFLSVE